MIKSYFKIALRNFFKHKAYGLINILGLTIGLACCIVIFQYVTFEYSFDRFHNYEENIYRIRQTTPLISEEIGSGDAYTGFALGPAIKADLPEVRYVSRIHPEYGQAIVSPLDQPEKVFEETKIYYTDKDFLKIFSFTLTSGNLEQALETGTALISESAAQKYFGDSNPIGKVIKISGVIEKNYLVTGTFSDVPKNSHLQFDFLFPVEDLIREGYSEEPEGGWSWNNFLTYILLQPGTDQSVFEKKLTDVYKTRRSEGLIQQQRTAKLWLQPLSDIHLNFEVDGPEVVMGSYRTVYFFSIIGLVVLIIALVNYINLETARALDRAREVGVRKVAGAHRYQLVIQFLFESAFMNIVAIGFAIVLVEVLTPVLNDIAGIQLNGISLMNFWFSGAFAAVFIFSTILAGLYPAFILSSFKPITSLKGKSTSSGSNFWMRRGLVVFQFAISVLLISGTFIVYNQLNFMQNMDLGLDLEHVIAVNAPKVMPEGSDKNSAVSVFINEVQQLPAIRQAAISTSLPGKRFNWNGASIRKPTDDPASAIRGVVTYIDTNFASLYKMKLVAGKGFRNISSLGDENTPWFVIANETAVKTLGFKSASEAINQPLDIGGYTAIIAGVFQDFNWSSAHIARQNMFFGYTEESSYISLRVQTKELPATVNAVENIYARLFPGNVFRYEFLDEVFDNQYKSDQHFATLFSVFAGIAIIIACLGLFGLTAFTTRQRTKEIGVRKVLGASVGSIAALLSKEFIILVAAGIMIASPLVYLLMNQWLNEFAYRVELEIGVFFISGFMVLMIALITVSTQSIKAALTNPVNTLKYE